MALVCEVCGKKPTTGNNVSHSNRRTRRRWLPNLHRLHVIMDGSPKHIKVCSKCIKKGNLVKAVKQPKFQVTPPSNI